MSHFTLRRPRHPGRLLFLLFLAFLIYLIAGAVLPFSQYATVSEATRSSVSAEDFRQDSPGSDRVMLLETNESALLERIRLLNQAKERIIISTFDMRSGESTEDILAMLLHKAEEGVSVQMIVDGFSGLIRMEGRPLFYALAAHPNAEIRIYNPINPLLPWKTQGRMHDKYVIVDDLAYILGGRNMFDYFIGDYPTDDQSHDREVLVYNTQNGTDHTGESSLFQVESYFQSVWELPDCKPFHDNESLLERERVQKQTEHLHDRYGYLLETYPEQFEPFDYEEATLTAGKITLISNPIGIYEKEPVVFYTLARLMEAAEEEVIIHTPYAVFNDYMYDTMKGITSKVPVTMMVNAVENGDNFVASSDYTYNKPKILETDVSLYEYSGGLSYHGKSLVIDNELAIIGSYNFDLRSTYMDTELMLCIQSEELAGELKAYMLDYQEDCRIVKSMEEQIVPEHVAIEEIPFVKNALWHIVGFLLKPFRYLI